MVFLEDIGHIRLIKLRRMKKMKLIKRSFIAIAAAAIFFNLGCHRVRKAVPDSMVTGQTVIAADEALLPLINAEIDVFQSLYNFASIDCKYGSEYDALNLLLKEETRLAIVTRPLNQKEIDFFKSKEIRAESIPIGYDAVALIVSSGNEIKVLTTLEISRILSGELNNWKQISNSGKDGNIRIVLDSESSGIIRSLNDSLHLNQKIAGVFQFSGSNKETIEKVAADPNAVGFIGINWLSETENPTVQDNLKKVNLIGVSKGLATDSTNCFAPTIGNIYNMKYPLTRKIYAVYTDPAASLARGFLAHLTSERGQKIIYRMGLKPENDFQRQIKINKDY
jgi:phosphate transport system substrate-binding protein